VNKLKLYGAALGTGVTFFSAVKFAEGTAQPSSAKFMSALFLTLILVAGFFLVRSYGRIQYQLDLLNRYLDATEGGNYHGTAPAPLQLKMTMGAAKNQLGLMQIELYDQWPPAERTQTRLAVGLELLAFIILILYVWIPVFAQPTSPSQPVVVTIIEQAKGPEAASSPMPGLGLLVSVHFEPNRTEVSSEVAQVLREAIRRVKGDDAICLRLDGYADLDGSAEYNLQISRLRAETVRAILESEGLKRERISVVAYGKTRPQSKGASESAKAQNRRVDLSVERCVSLTK
jgi:peptidoglycan-associated lipoprotein